MDQNSNNDRPILREIPNEIAHGEELVKDGVKDAISLVREKSKESADKVKEEMKNRTQCLADNASIVRHRVSSFSKASIKVVNELKVKYWDGRLVKYSELSEWMKDNEYIENFYRPELSDTWTCIKTLFRVHCETGNIWTHLIGALVFLSLFFHYLLKDNIEFVSPLEEKSIGLIFFCCAFMCLSFSTSFHLFGCHSFNVCLLCGRLDYAGIAVLITGSYLPWVYYNFYCESTTKLAYMSIIICFGIMCACISFAKSFQRPEYRVFRGLLFTCFGFTGLVPLFHALYANGLEASISQGQIHWLVIMGVVYGSGAAFFITRFPECVWPGKFDILLHSHQIFHVCVLVAALAQAYALFQMRNIRFQLGNSCDI